MKISSIKLVVVFLIFFNEVSGQTFNFPTTVIPTGGQTCLPVNVVMNPPIYGLGDPVSGPFPCMFIGSVCINIQTSHPWTLVVNLVAPNGTTLNLTSYNGAGGSNYTGTCFSWYAINSIVTAAPPFTGLFDPQQTPPGFSIFNTLSPPGIWQLCIEDTLTDTTTVIPGPPGFGATSVGSGTIGFGTSCPPCGINNGSASGYICPNGTIDLGIFVPGPPIPPTVIFYDNMLMPIGSVVSSPGQYYIYMEDNCNASCFGWIDVTIYPATAPILGPDQIVDACPGIPVNLPALFTTAGLSQTWTYNGIPTTFAAVQAATLPGVYQIIGQNSNLCTDTAIATLNHLVPPSLGPNQTIIGCTVAPFNLTTVFNTTGLTSTWTINGNPVLNPTAVVVNGNYTLVAADANGCTDTAVVTLSLSVSPNLGPDQSTSVCDGIPVNLTALYNTTGLTPSWSFMGSPVLNPSAVTLGGIYTLIATNANGCADTAQVTVTVNSAPVPGPPQVLDFCSNTSVDLTTLYNTTGLVAVWTLSGNPVINPSAVTTGGVYTLTVTNAAGCSGQVTATLNSLTAPDLGPDQNASICPGTTVNLSTIFTNTGWNGVWTLNGNAVANPAMVSVPGSYQLAATAANGCTDLALVIVGTSPAPILGPDQSAAACANSGVNLNALFNTSGYAVSWSLSGVPVSNPSMVISPGQYQLIATNAGGCSDTAIAFININSVPILGADSTVTFCQGGYANLTGYYNLAGLSAQWTLNGVTVTDPSAVNATGNYQLIASNASGCSDTAIVQVTVNPNPDPGPDQSFQLCPWMTVDMTNLFNTSNWTVVWTQNGQPYQPEIVESDSGTYSIYVADGNGCTGTANVVVTNITCDCIADFVYEGSCMQEPVTFTILSDSVVTAAHWNFGASGLNDQFVLSPAVQFPSANAVTVSLEVTLSCGSWTVVKNILLEDCSGYCRFFIPSAFTPNNNGVKYFNR